MNRKTTLIDYPNNSATALYEAIRCGDELAFVRYYESSMNWLVANVERITNDIEEARNIAHDTFAKLWLQRELIDITQSLDGFISKMAANAALDFLRKRRAAARYRGEQFHVSSQLGYSADAQMIADDTDLLLSGIISRMPLQRRKIYLLSRNENLTYNEIAERLNLSYGTVHKHMKLALKELRQILSIIILWLFLH